MTRYLVQRTFPEGLEIPIDHTGAETSGKVVAGNAAHGVTWLHSYVLPDRPHDLLHLRRPRLVRDPLCGRDQRPAGRRHHRGVRARPVLLPLMSSLTAHHRATTPSPKVGLRQ